MSTRAPLFATLSALMLCASTCFAQSGETTTQLVNRCIAEHERAQLSRLQKRWLEARSALAACADESCPLAIRTDCRDWSEELSRALPTILIVVERDDDGAAPVTLELDGQVQPLSNEPRPIEVLPGRHHLKISLASYSPNEQDISLAEGEKNHVVRVSFRRPPAPAPLKLTPPRFGKPIPPSSYWFGGLALGSFAASGALLGSALVSLNSARDSCAPECPTSQRRSIQSRLLAADIAGGVGLVLAGAAAYSFWKRPTVQLGSVSIWPEFSWSLDSGTMALEGRFW